jgi:photosystem II stability/assembly factor-like uncharacterized protein
MAVWMSVARFREIGTPDIHAAFAIALLERIRLPGTAYPSETDLHAIVLCCRLENGSSDFARAQRDKKEIDFMKAPCRNMRLILILTAGLICLPLTANAQSEVGRARWIKQAPIPTWYSLQGIAPLSPNECWIASAPLLGEVGELAHTTDAGRSWTVVALDRQVNAVAFVDPLHGWAAGNAFYHTTDGGQTWIKDNNFGTVYDLFFLDTLHGWACGNGSVNYYTTDGGLRWHAVSAPGGSTMGSIFFTDLLNGWSVNLEGQIFHSTDGGQSWTLKATVTGTNLQMIQFFDLQEGWVIGGDAFYHTLNGGQTWTRSTVPPNTWAYGARFFDRLHGVAVGEYGNIVRTTDGGTSWQTIQPQGSGQRLWDIEYSGADTVFLAGDNGVISRSTNAGATWASIQSGGAAMTHGFDSVDARHAWAGQDAGEIVYTLNGGRQWIRASVQGFDVFGKIMAVAFADSSTGWAGGSNAFFGGSSGRVSRSTNGGKTWQQQLEIPDFTFEGLETINTLTAFAVGGYDLVGGGLVLRTVNGGSSWQDVSPISAGFRDVSFIDAATGWVVGPSIYKTTDGGTSWIKQFGDGSTEFTAISFSDSQNGWAVGFANLVLHTTDGGQNWVAQDVGAPPLTAINGVTAVNSSTAWIAGWYGFVARTTDSGQTWRSERIAGAEAVDFEDALFLDAQNGWVGGNIGIWKRQQRQ